MIGRCQWSGAMRDQAMSAERRIVTGAELLMPSFPNKLRAYYLLRSIEPGELRDMTLSFQPWN